MAGRNSLCLWLWVLSMHGKAAVELLREYQRQGGLPSYEEAQVRRVIDETNALHKEVLHVVAELNRETEQLQALAPNDPEREVTQERVRSLSNSLAVHYSTMHRNKRCLLAYHRARMQALQDVRWDVGGIMPASIAPNLAPDELRYFQRYTAVLARYMAGTGHDLTSGLVPPKDLLIEVRVLQQYGEVMTSQGTVSLDKNSVHFLRRDDVEALIRQGVVEHIVH